MPRCRLLVFALAAAAVGAWACGEPTPGQERPGSRAGGASGAPRRAANSTDGVGAAIRSSDVDPTSGNPLAPEGESSTAGSTGTGGEVEAPAPHGGSTGSGLTPFRRDAEQAPA